MDHKELNRRVRDLVRSLLEMPENSVRPANQNAPTGAIDEQFATVLLTVFNPTGQDELHRQDEAAPSTNIVETVIGPRRCVASVQFFRGDAYYKAMRLPALLSTSAAIEKMQKHSLGLIRTSQPRNLTALVDTLWEERGQIDLEFYVVAAESVSVPTFGRFPISIDTNQTLQTFEVFEP
jgi:hypothetical protein